MQNTASFLRWIDHNTVNICTLVVFPIVKTTDSDSIVTALFQIEHEGRTQDNTLVCVPLVQRLQLLRLVIDNDTRNTTQLPSAIDAIRSATRLIAEAHVVRVLIVERDPLGFATALNVVECNFAVVAIDTCDNDFIACETGFLMPCFTSRCSILVVVGSSFYGRDFTSFYIEIVDIVPYKLKRLFVLVDLKWKPDISVQV